MSHRERIYFTPKQDFHLLQYDMLDMALPHQQNDIISKNTFLWHKSWVCLWKPDNLAGCFAPRALIPHSAELVYSQALFWSKLVPLEAKCGKLGFRTVHSGDSSGQHGYDISSLDPFVQSLRLCSRRCPYTFIPLV